MDGFPVAQRVNLSCVKLSVLKAAVGGCRRSCLASQWLLVSHYYQSISHLARFHSLTAVPRHGGQRACFGFFPRPPRTRVCIRPAETRDSDRHGHPTSAGPATAD